MSRIRETMCIHIITQPQVVDLNSPTSTGGGSSSGSGTKKHKRETVSEH